MFDLENVVDNQTAAEELEEVVMGLSSILVRRAAWHMARSEKRKKAILRRRKR